MLLDLEEKTRAVEDIVERSAIKRGVFVLGLSSSEVAGGIIEKLLAVKFGQRIVKTILEVLEPKGIYFGCSRLRTFEISFWLLSVSPPWLKIWKLLMFFRPCMLGKWSAGCFRL